MDTFFETLQPLIALSEESKGALIAVAHRTELPKGRTLIQPGSICDTEYFIERGLVRTYYSKDARNVTDWLSADGDLVVSVISFLTGQ